jgi:hypothetical protein
MQSTVPSVPVAASLGAYSVGLIGSTTIELLVLSAGNPRDARRLVCVVGCVKSRSGSPSEPLVVTDGITAQCTKTLQWLVSLV